MVLLESKLCPAAGWTNLFVFPSVGPGVGRSAHPPSVQHAAGQVQEAAGPGEDPAHPLHGEPLHQGELRLPEDPRRGRPHSPRRL